MNAFDLFVLIAFAVLLGSFLAIAAIVLMIGNELRKSQLVAKALSGAVRDPHQIAAELQARFDASPEALGGLQEDVASLTAELSRPHQATVHDASNDPGGPFSGPGSTRAGAPCDFCRRLRERAKRTLRALKGR